MFNGVVDVRPILGGPEIQIAEGRAWRDLWRGLSKLLQEHRDGEDAKT